jgi:hypothetical protein
LRRHRMRNKEHRGSKADSRDFHGLTMFRKRVNLPLQPRKRNRASRIVGYSGLTTVCGDAEDRLVARARKDPP